MPIWKARWVLCLALLGATVNSVLALALLARLPQLPEIIPVHVGNHWDPDLVGDKHDILRLPIIGALLWAGNLGLAIPIHRLGRCPALLMIGAGTLLPVILFLSALHLIG